MKKKRQIREIKETKNKVIAIVIAFLLVFILVFCFLFREDIISAIKNIGYKEPTWNEEKEFGEIEIINKKPEETKKQKEITDSLGINYTFRDIPKFGYQVPIPDNWELYSDGSVIYSMPIDFKSSLGNIEIMIIPAGYFTEEENVSLTAVRNNSFRAIQSIIRYHGFNDNYELGNFNFYADAVDKGGYLYQPATTSIQSSLQGVKSYEQASISMYFKYIENQSYCILAIGSENQLLEVEEIAKTVAANMEKIENDKYLYDEKIDSVSKNVIYSNGKTLEYCVDKEWEEVHAFEDKKDSNVFDASFVYKLSDDPQSMLNETYITVQESKNVGLDIESYQKEIDFSNSQVLDMEQTKTIEMLQNNDCITNFQEYSYNKISTNGISGKSYTYSKYYDGKNGLMDLNYIQLLNMGNVYNYTYVYEVSKDNVVLITINYNENNEEIAKECLDRFVTKLQLD